VRTPSQTVGPFYSIGLCRSDDNVLADDGIELRGQLYDGRGELVTDGMIEVWEPIAEKWGRCGTHPDGAFRFVVPRDVASLYVWVFARGLLRHELTRVYLADDASDDLLASLSPEQRTTLVARREGDGLRFDIRLQGDDATVFFEH
jgi:protocatechuate 3,4-dioxygenase, alpha subunit